MDKIGRVVSTYKDIAKLEVKKVSACGSNCATCSAGCEQQSQVIDVLNTLGVKEGDFVEVKSDSERVLKYMLIIYGIPLLFLLSGLLISYIFLERSGASNLEIKSTLVGVIAMVISGLIINRVDKNLNVKSQDINVMVRKL